MRVICYSPQYDKPFIAHPTDLHSRCFAAVVLSDGYVALLRRKIYWAHGESCRTYQIFLLPLWGGGKLETMDAALEAREQEMARNRLPQILKALRISDWEG